MSYMNFKELHSLVLYVKFHIHRPTGFGKEYFKGFCYFDFVEKMFEDGGQRQRRRRTTVHGYSISSSCEPYGSGELITPKYGHT